MTPGWQLPLAWKILFFRGNPTIQKFSIATAMGAIAVGVASLVVTLGVIDGMHWEIKHRILGLSPHVFIRVPEEEPSFPSAGAESVKDSLAVLGNPAVAPFAIGQAMLRSQSATLGTVVKAIDPERETGVTQIRSLLIDGEWLAGAPAAGGSAVPSSPASGGLAGAPVPGSSGSIPILLGKEAAQSLSVWTGGELALILPASSGLAGLPHIRKAHVAGIFKSGYYEYDSNLVLLPLSSALNIWKRAGRSAPELSFWYGVRGPDAEKAPEFAKAVQDRLEGREDTGGVYPWSRMNQSLFSALKLEKIMLTLVLSLIIFVASVSVSSNLIMIAAQKTKMIGTLRSLGVSRASLIHLMLTLGGLIGAIGSAIGLGLSCLVIWVIQNTDWVKLPAEIYMIERLPIRLTVWDVAGVVALAWLLSLLASAIPAYRTSRLEAGEVLKYG